MLIDDTQNQLELRFDSPDVLYDSHVIAYLDDLDYQDWLDKMSRDFDAEPWDHMTVAELENYGS